MSRIVPVPALPVMGSAVQRERPLRKLPQILCGFFIVLYTFFFLYRAVTALLYPYPLLYGEGAVFYEAGQLRLAGFNPTNLYPPNTEPPYRAGIYNPFFYYLQAATMLLTGPTSLLGGRLITLGAALYLGLTLYRVTRTQELVEGRRAGLGIGLAAALTPFATAAVYSWGVIAKADMLAIALSMATMVQVWKTQNDRRRPSGLSPYLVAGGLAALALLTKQSALAAPAAVLIYLALGRRWREAGAFAGAMTGSGAVAAAGLQLATGGAYFRHVVTYNAQPYDFEFLGAALRYLFWEHIVLLVLALIWVGRPLIGRYERVDLWRIYFLTALAVSFSAGKVGADFNYYIESLALMSLLAWWQAGRWLKLRPQLRPGPFRVGLATLGLLAMVIQLFQLHHIPLLADGASTPGPGEFERAGQVARVVWEQAGRGPMLAEDSGWQAVEGLPVELDDPFVFGQLAPARAWDSTLFLERLGRGYFKTIMFEISQPDTVEEALQAAVRDGTAAPFPRRFAPEVLAIIQDRTRYIPSNRVGRWLFLEWRGR